jgi:hypothetical protein
MKAEYINRRKEAHYLKSVLTKNGKERFYIVKNKSKFNPDELLLDIPSGFEFYEFPNDAQVVLRKKLHTNINYGDIQIVDKIMQNHRTATDYILDKDQNGIIVYVGHMSVDDFPELKERFHLIQSYNETLRFEKVNEDLYKAQRFCHISRHYGWITMESNEDLEYLAEKYCYHVDKESLLEFWIEGEDDW